MQCTIKAIQSIAVGTLEVRLTPQGAYPTIQPGQCVQVTIPNPTYRDTKPTEEFCNKRIFSFVHYPTLVDGASSEISFTTRLSNSAFKRSLAELKVGDTLELSDPMGNFTLPPASDSRELVFIGGGIGITPFITMLEYVQATKSNHRITLIFTNNDIATMPYKEYVEQLATSLEGLEVHLSIHKDEAWSGESRFISKSLIEDLIPGYMKKTFMMVGPPIMVQIVKPILLDELQIPEEQIIVENFAGY